MITIKDIKEAAQGYAEAVRTLRNTKEAIDAEHREIDRKHNDKFMTAIKAAGEAKQMVLTLLNDPDAPALFERPKTISIDGVTVGFRKMKGKFNFQEATTIKLIMEQIPEKAMLLLKETVSVASAGLDSLKADELKKIGVEIKADSDEPVVKATDGELQKFIDKAVEAYRQSAE